MLTLTGRYTFDGLTETGEYVFDSLTETGRYVVPDENSALYELLMSGGAVIGGSIAVVPFSALAMSGGSVTGGSFNFWWTWSFKMTGGSITGGGMLKKQITFPLYAPDALSFRITDASINFKLEQQP